jgi:predicted transcriptional regulator
MTPDVRQTILDAIQQPKPGVEAVTTEELAEASGRYYLTVRAELRRLLGEGQIETVRVPRRCIDGVVRKVAGYRPRA